MGKLDEIRDKLESLVVLPGCLVEELLSHLGILDRKESQHYIARHEAGHALAVILAGIRVDSASISRVSGQTLKRLSTLLSPWVTFHQGSVDFPDAKSPHQDALISLAGLVGTSDHPDHADRFEGVVNKDLLDGENAEWTDIQAPCSYIAQRFEALRQKKPDSVEVKELFLRFYEQLQLQFKDPRFICCLDIITEQIERHELKDGDVNGKILDALLQAGFNEEALKAMGEALFLIDVDGLILDGGLSVAA